MSELLEFVSRVLEREGAIVERRDGRVEAVLTEELREALGLPEFCVLSGEEGWESCGYGSETLARVAQLALGSGRVAAFRAQVPESRPHEPSGFKGLNLALRVAGVRSGSKWTLSGCARYQANADDQREGLCEAAVSAPDGVPVGVPDLASLPLAPLAPEKLSREPLRAAFPKLLSVLRARCVAEVRDFREAVGKRRLRDAQRIQKYFDDVSADLRRRLRKGGAPLRRKLDAIPAELARKLAELDADATVRVRMELASLVALLAPGLTADLEVRRRKHVRILEASYHGIARRWWGLRCDGCGEGTLAFAMCDEAAHVFCARCWDSCGTGGHRPCFRCEGKPERPPWATSG